MLKLQHLCRRISLPPCISGERYVLHHEYCHIERRFFVVFTLTRSWIRIEHVRIHIYIQDALIKWPGAEGPVIHDRDEYMAYATYSILANEPQGLTPAYLRKKVTENASTYLYAMPTGGCSSVSPPGKGLGQFSLPSVTQSSKDNNQMGKPKPINTVVAIVGTAHVRGMARHWETLSREGFNKESSNTSYLEKFCS